MTKKIESPQDFAREFESKKLTVEDVNQLFEKAYDDLVVKPEPPKPQQDDE